MAREAARAHRQGDRDPRRPARARSCGSATSTDGIVGLRPGSEIVLTDRGLRRHATSGSPSPTTAFPRRSPRTALVYLADGRIRLRVLETGDDEVRCAVEVGGRVSSHQGLNLPGAEVGLPAAGREDLAWVDFAIEHGIDLLAVSFVRRAEDLAPVERRVRTGGSDIPVIAKIEKPQAAERAEEIVKAVTAGIMVARGDLGIELPIEQVPDASSARLLALAGKLLAALDHRDPDARLDGRLAAPDPGRGLRRRQRDLPGHRRGDALRGDRGRRVPGRGGPGDGPDRARDRARPPLRRLGLQPRRLRRRRRRQLGRPRRGRRRPTRSASRRSSSRRAAGAPPGSSPPTARGRRCSRSRRGSRPSAGSTCCSASSARSPTSGPASPPCSTTAPGSRARPASRKSGDLIAITAGPAPAGPRHEPVRDPPGAVSSPAQAKIARLAAPLALMALIFYLSAQRSVGPELPAFTRVDRPLHRVRAARRALGLGARPGARAPRDRGRGRDLRSSTRSATSSTRASSRAATRTRSTSSSTAAGSRSVSSQRPAVELGEQLRVGVRHPADRLAVPAHVAGHRDLKSFSCSCRLTRRRSGRRERPSRGSAAGRASRRRRRWTRARSLNRLRQPLQVVGEAVADQRRSSWHLSPGGSRKVLGIGVEQPARELLGRQQQRAVGRPRVALDEAEPVVGDDEVERDLARVAELGDDRLDQPQRLARRRSTRTGSRSSGATGAGSGTCRCEVTLPSWTVE